MSFYSFFFKACSVPPALTLYCKYKIHTVLTDIQILIYT